MSQPDKRRKILDAAVRVFAQNGFYNSKVAQIAREAGVADGTIYLYFKSKEDILVQVFMDTMEQALRIQEDALAGLECPVERLRRFIRVHFESVSQSPALAEVITVELRQSSKFMRGTDMKPFGRYLGIIARIVSDGQARGLFSPTCQPRRVARMLFGAVDELALEWAMDDRGTALEDAWGETASIFLDGLLVRPSVARDAAPTLSPNTTTTPATPQKEDLA